MCGLFGIAGRGIQNVDLDILNDLGTVSMLRGTDSTGVVQGEVLSNGIKSLLVEKDNTEFSYFSYFHKRSTQGNRKVLDGLMNNFFCCHVRAATRGSLTKENAHPFKTGRYVSMHNGTLKDKRYFHTKKTDSELMFEDVESFGLENTLRNLDKDSAYAVVVLDRDEGVIHFARNHLRTLFFCFAKDRPVMYWASEPWMLYGTIKRRGVEIVQNQTWAFSPEKIYTIDPRDVPRTISDLKSKNIRPISEKTDKPRLIASEKKVVKEKEKEEKRNQEGIRQEVKSVDKKPQDNVIKFPDLKGIESNIGGLLDGKYENPYYCCGCSRQLTLLEKYFNRIAGMNSVLCDSCQDTSLLITKQNVMN